MATVHPQVKVFCSSSMPTFYRPRRVAPAPGHKYTDRMADDDPTVLWRMTRGRSSAHATIIPGPSQTTITWFFDGVMDRIENYDTVALALARADDIKGVLLRDGWTEA